MIPVCTQPSAECSDGKSAPASSWGNLLATISSGINQDELRQQGIFSQDGFSVFNPEHKYYNRWWSVTVLLTYWNLFQVLIGLCASVRQPGAQWLIALPAVVCKPVCLRACLPTSLPACLPICVCVCVCVCLSVCLSVYLSS